MKLLHWFIASWNFYIVFFPVRLIYSLNLLPSNFPSWNMFSADFVRLLHWYISSWSFYIVFSPRETDLFIKLAAFWFSFMDFRSLDLLRTDLCSWNLLRTDFYSWNLVHIVFSLGEFVYWLFLRFVKHTGSRNFCRANFYSSNGLRAVVCS